MIYQLGGAPDGGYIVNTRWITPFIAMTLSTNIFCTCSFLFSRFIGPFQPKYHPALIAVKVWKINSFSSRFIIGHSLTPVMLVVIESGAIYSCTLIALLVSYLTKSWAQYLILDWVKPRALSCRNNMLTLRGFPGIAHRSKGHSNQVSIPPLTPMQPGLCFQHGDRPARIGALQTRWDHVAVPRAGNAQHAVAIPSATQQRGSQALYRRNDHCEG